MTHVWGTSRRYHAYADQFRQQYGERIQKVSVNAGFTCPNRDGHLAVGGCSYCNNRSFTPSYCRSIESIQSQIEKGIRFLSRRYRRTKKYLAYFQSFSNTYAPLAELKEIYQAALSHPLIHGLVISTRPDCIDEEKLAYLSGLSKDYIIQMEYGIESCYDLTLQMINRQHNFDQARRAIFLTADHDLPVAVHLLFGLPGDSEQMMLDQAGMLSELPIKSLKLHQLQVIKGTAIARQYHEQPELFRLFSLEGYLLFIVSFLERLNPDISVQRFVSEVPPAYKIAPVWGSVRSDVLNQMIEEKLACKNTWQGKYYNKPS
ncbi:MAG: TIGR01212 family radical SAM protein [Candidatus Cyclobacteriaceae bacterium M3_2C_046]